MKDWFTKFHMRLKGTTLVLFGLLLAILSVVVYRDYLPGLMNNNLSIGIILPLDESLVSGPQTFLLNVDGLTKGMDVHWEVDGGIRKGELVLTDELMTGNISTDDWNWRKDNTYVIEFFVQKNERVLAVAERTVYTLEASDHPIVVDVGLTAREDTPIKPDLSLNEPIVAGVSDSRVPELSLVWLTKEHKDWITQDIMIKVAGLGETEYVPYWRVAGGHANAITKRLGDGSPVVGINFSGWWWQGSGPYQVDIILESLEGEVIGSSSFWFNRGNDNLVMLDGIDSVVALAVSDDFSRVTTSEPVIAVALPLSSNNSSVSNIAEPTSNSSWRLPAFASAYKPAIKNDLDQAARDNDEYSVESISYVYDQPQSTWLNGNDYDFELIKNVIQEAKDERSTPIFVLYNIPQRDCGMYSSGGANDYIEYEKWIDRIKSSIDHDAAFVVEPDALAMLSCLSTEGQAKRIGAIRYAVEQLTQLPNVYVYIDAGHAFWVNTKDMSERLQRVAVDKARGFALNTSNYVEQADSIRYGNQLSGLLGGKYYVIDSSRNGQGSHPGYEWCNPDGRGLGEVPTLHFEGWFDASLWIKTPGESDGYCNGGPGAGTWWRDYVVDLYSNRAN